MYLGLDLGTSGVRGLLMDEAGAPIGAAEAHYDVSHPAPGWSEQAPEDWLNATATVIAALQSHGLDALKGISFSGHMHGAVALDAGGAVLRPAILWNDTRAATEAAALDATEMRAISGNIVFPGFTAPKLVWMAQHEPDLFARVATVMLPKDYVAFWLTGRRVTDMSDAAGTSWLDVAERRWSTRALERTRLSLAHMPELLEGTDIVGPILGERAAALGLPPHVQIVTGGADNAVAACGVGALSEGQGFVSLGTSGVLLTGRDRCAPAPETAVHTFCHAVPGRWYQMGVTLAATDSLNWLARITGQTPEALSTAAGDLRAPGLLRFYPYLSGERTPHNDSRIRGGFTGLDIADGPGDLARAVMEGVAFALRDSLEALRATGVDLQTVLAIGGGTRSRLWTEMLATVLDMPLQLPAQGDFGAALGAARLAMCGVTGAKPDDIMAPPPIAETIDPNAALAPAFADAYAAYRAGYPKLKDLQ